METSRHGIMFMVDAVPFMYTDRPSAMLLIDTDDPPQGSPPPKFMFSRMLMPDDDEGWAFDPSYEGTPSMVASDLQASDLQASTSSPVAADSSSHHQRGCRCMRNKCLKMYCECLAAGQPCGKSCRCNRCGNQLTCQRAEVKRLRRTIHLSIHNDSAPHCNCKRSRCLKKYCDCYKAGAACGDRCRCTECENNTSVTF